MSDINQAIAKVLNHEGGYADNPNDPGGETNFGISKRAYPDLDIKNLTREKAMAIYQRDYVLPLYSQIESQAVLNALTDFGVTSGTLTAIKELQRSINAVVAGPLPVDGVFGPKTLEFANACDQLRLALEFTRRRILFYHSLAGSNLFFESWCSRSFDW